MQAIRCTNYVYAMCVARLHATAKTVRMCVCECHVIAHLWREQACRDGVIPLLLRAKHGLGRRRCGYCRAYSDDEHKNPGGARHCCNGSFLVAVLFSNIFLFFFFFCSCFCNIFFGHVANQAPVLFLLDQRQKPMVVFCQQRGRGKGKILHYQENAVVNLLSSTSTLVPVSIKDLTCADS
jgi:hypothetical protein